MLENIFLMTWQRSPNFTRIVQMLCRTHSESEPFFSDSFQNTQAITLNPPEQKIEPIPQASQEHLGNLKTLQDEMYTDMAYPEDSERYDSLVLLEKIISLQGLLLLKELSYEALSDDFLIENSKALRSDGKNFLIIPLPDQYILGLVFSSKTNPYDYRNEVIRLIQEYFLDLFHKSSKEKQRTNLLLTLFVDLRKYADENLAFQQDQQHPIMVINNIPMVKVFVYGIDNAGKSSLMRLLSIGKFDQDYFPPTKKFRITNITLKSGVRIVAWDMPGQRIFRKDWLRGAQASNILLFVLDLNDEKRFEEARTSLWNMLDLYELQGVPLIFLANKTDLLTNIPSLEQIRRYFKLNSILDREVYTLFSSLPKNHGVPDLVGCLEQQVDELLLVNNLSTQDPAFNS